MRAFRILAVLVLAASHALAQSTNRTERMTLQQAIEMALEHNLDVQIRRLNPEISFYNLHAVYGAYDPILSASGEHDYSRLPGGIDPQGRSFSGTEIESDRIGAGLSGYLPWGMTYNFNGNLTDQYGTRPGSAIASNETFVVTNSFTDINTGNPITFLSTNFGTTQIRSPFESTAGNIAVLQLRQPLLKNFWIDSTRLQIYLNRRNVKISELDLEAQIINTVTAVEEAYYNLVYAQQNVRVQQSATELADRLLAENRKRVEVGTMAPLDEKQAQSQVASSRADLIDAQGSEQTQQRRLKNLLTDDYAKWAEVSIVPTDMLMAIRQQFSLQESWRKGFALRPDLLQAKLTLEKQGYVLKYQQNQIFPQLDVFGDYGFNAGGVEEFSGALNQFRTGENPFYAFGAQITFPLTQTGARNNFKSAKATREQIALQFKQLEQNVMVQIEDAISTANTAFERLNARKEASSFAAAALDAEQRKLAAGKSTSFVVLQLQRDLTAARTAEIRALADYNIALAEIARQEGSTLERNKIDLVAN
jgi:outer membrane protein TolC